MKLRTHGIRWEYLTCNLTPTLGCSVEDKVSNYKFALIDTLSTAGQYLITGHACTSINNSSKLEDFITNELRIFLHTLTLSIIMIKEWCRNLFRLNRRFYWARNRSDPKRVFALLNFNFSFSARRRGLKFRQVGFQRLLSCERQKSGKRCAFQLVSQIKAFEMFHPARNAQQLACRVARRQGLYLLISYDSYGEK